MLCFVQIEIAQRKTYIQWIWKKAENATRDQRTNAFSSHSKTSKEAQARSRKHNGAIKLERSQCKQIWKANLVQKSDNLQYTNTLNSKNTKRNFEYEFRKVFTTFWMLASSTIFVHSCHNHHLQFLPHVHQRGWKFKEHCRWRNYH